jgi:hypothetical protein
MGDLLEDIKEDSSDFLAKSTKKGSSGRKKSDLGLGPFRDFPIPARKGPSAAPNSIASNPVTPESATEPAPDKPVSFRSDSGLNPVSITAAPEQTGLKTGLNPADVNASAGSNSRGISPRQLRKNPKKVLRYLYQAASQSGERTTPSFNIVDAAADINIPYESFRTALKILRGYNFIERISYRAGPNGWCQFQIPKVVFKDLYELYSIADEEHTFKQPGLKSGLSQTCSSSMLSNNTTTTATALEEIDRIEALSHVDLGTWNISKKMLVKHIGPGKTCESVKDMEEFLHRASAAIESLRARGDAVRSPAGFLMHCLNEGYVGVPDGYKSLEELRLEKMNRETRERLDRIKAAKEEKCRMEFELFREELDSAEKRSMLERIRDDEGKSHPAFASKETLERSIQVRFKEELIQKFCERFTAAERVYVESCLKTMD